jgi:hypothetical protein
VIPDPSDASAPRRSAGEREVGAASVSCRSCGAWVVRPSRFCTTCGTAVEEDEHSDHGGGAIEGDEATDHGAGALDGSWRVCAACDADNVVDRLLCGSCGADLDGADHLVVAALPDRRFLARPDDDEPAAPGRGWLVTLVAVLAVVAAALAVLVVAQVGPFAEPEGPLEPVAFPADRYELEPRTLDLVDVATLTSRGPEGDRRFGPESLVDGDDATAWHGDTEQLPALTSEKIDVGLGSPAWVSGLVIANGDHLDADAYADAGRVQRLEIGVDGGGVVAATLLDHGLQPQLIELSEPVLTTALRLEVVETVGGESRDAPALSQLSVRGMPAEGADVDLARERAEERPATGAVTLGTGRS